MAVSTFRLIRAMKIWILDKTSELNEKGLLGLGGGMCPTNSV